MENVGVIVDYKYLVGDLQGKIYRKRFETVDGFLDWSNEYVKAKIVKIIGTKMVESKNLYWDYRWATEVKASV